MKIDTKNNSAFLQCSRSATRHFDCAKILAKQNYFDIAIGHIILGAEESIKALLYYSRTVDFMQFDEPPGIFKDHNVKHKVLADAHSNWLSVLESILTNFNVLPNHRKIMLDHIHENCNHDDAEIIRWWKKANKLKNTGWYVTESNGTLITPERITKDDYEEAIKITLTLELSLVAFTKLREIELEKL